MSTTIENTKDTENHDKNKDTQQISADATPFIQNNAFQQYQATLNAKPFKYYADPDPEGAFVEDDKFKLSNSEDSDDTEEKKTGQTNNNSSTFCEQSKSCECCHGYIHACNTCKDAGECKCTIKRDNIETAK